jgi:hypothetical protein
VKNMQLIMLAGIVSGVIALSLTATHAATWDAEIGRHITKTHRPARAVTFNKPPLLCSWVGPGGRAIYLCR